MAWGHALAAAFGGYMKGRQARLDKEDDESERAWRTEQRGRQRAEQQRQDRLQSDLETAARPVAMEMGAGGALKPDYADNRDMDGSVQPIAGGFRVAGQDFSDRASADAALAKANSADAVGARVAGAYRRNGQVEKAMALEQGAMQAKAAQLQLDEATERRLKAAADTVMMRATSQGPEAFAKAVSGSPVVGGAQVSAVVAPDGKSFQLMSAGPDGSQVPVGAPLPTAAKELQLVGQNYLQSLSPGQMIDVMRHQHQIEQEAARSKQAQSNADRSFGLQEKQFAHSQQTDRQRLAIAQQQVGIMAQRYARLDKSEQAKPFDPLHDFDPKQARKEAMDLAKAEAEQSGTAYSERRAQEIFGRLRDEASADNTNRHIQQVTSKALRAAKSDPGEYAEVYQQALQVADRQTLSEWGFNPPGATGGAKPAAPAAAMAQQVGSAPAQSAARQAAPAAGPADAAGARLDAARAAVASLRVGPGLAAGNAARQEHEAKQAAARQELAQAEAEYQRAVLPDSGAAFVRPSI